MASAWVAGLAIALAGCQVPLASLPAACDAPTDLFEVTEVLAAADHPCLAWVEDTHGRVARTASASAVVYSRQTTSGNGLLVSAMHALPVGTFGETGTTVPAMFRDPRDEPVIARFRMIEEAGAELREKVSPAFTLFTPLLPAEQHVGGFDDLLPRHDFFLAVTDDQEGSLDDSFESLQDGMTRLHDPAGATLSADATADVAAGAVVLIIGYPASPGVERRQKASAGRVLTDAEARAAVALLADAGDVEGEIPYDAEAEFFIEGTALPGMSGGGIFDRDGSLVGVLVRATDMLDDLQYIRAVRMTFILDTLDGLVRELPDEEQSALADLVETLP